jgi:hypothetical protein
MCSAINDVPNHAADYILLLPTFAIAITTPKADGRQATQFPPFAPHADSDRLYLVSNSDRCVVFLTDTPRFTRRRAP